MSRPILRNASLILTLSAVLAGSAAHAVTTAELSALVDQRLAGDRSGACMAVAVIEGDQVARTYRCADPANQSRIGADTAFEIGSVSKTMTAVLLADLIARGEASLDDRLADYLPEGTRVPTFEGQPILLRHVVTHTSGLPALPLRLGATDLADPYANLTVEALLASLGDVTLTAAPGTRFEYSNFASMVLSYALARRAGEDFETLLKRKLFTPLGMDKAYVNTPPAGVRAAIGHTPNDAQPTSPWRFVTDVAGVGGVRATLDDMVRYVQGSLGRIETPLAAAISLAQQPVSAEPPMAMNWMLMDVDGRTVHVHEGGTGGFSSWVSVDLDRQRGVVILSDTTWNSIGSLGSLGLHLVDGKFPLGKPRKEVAPDPALLAALEGRYDAPGLGRFELVVRDGQLIVQGAGRPASAMGYDSAGDFYPRDFDAILRPRKRADGSYGFNWMMMGGVFAATRVEAKAPGQSISLTASELAQYAGNYPLMDNFALAVRGGDGVLLARATGQGEFPLQAVGKDRFEAADYGIELVFRRGDDGQVTSLELHQAGQVLSGTREVR